MDKLLAVAPRFILWCLLLALPLTSFAQVYKVKINPTQGPPGTRVTGTGTDWPYPGDSIQVTWDDASLTVPNTTVGGDGGFSVPFNVPSNAAAGTHTIRFTASGSQHTPFGLPVDFAVTTATTPGSQSPPLTCKPALFIGLRGSGEKANYASLGDTVEAFYKKFKETYGEDNVEVYGVPYQAAPAPVPNFGEAVGDAVIGIGSPGFDSAKFAVMLANFSASVAEGTTELEEMINSRRVICPDQLFVIVGYSQGAWATGDALADLDTSVLSHISAVVLLGDPKLWWRDPNFEGIATKLPPAWGPRQPYYMPWMISDNQVGLLRFRSYCMGQDPVCNATHFLDPQDPQGILDWLSWVNLCANNDPSCQHFMYGKGSLPQDVASWFVERLDQGPTEYPVAPTPTPTPAPTP